MSVWQTIIVDFSHRANDIPSTRDPAIRFRPVQWCHTCTPSHREGLQVSQEVDCYLQNTHTTIVLVNTSYQTIHMVACGLISGCDHCFSASVRVFALEENS